MAQIPKYMVTLPPGAPIAGVGFVRPGEIFTAPAVDYVPSRTFRAVNEEAKAVLLKLHGEVVAQAESRLAGAEEKEDKRQAVIELARVKAARQAAAVLVDIPKVEPKVEKGLSLKDLGEVNGGAKPDAGKPADRKL